MKRRRPSSLTSIVLTTIARAAIAVAASWTARRQLRPAYTLAAGPGRSRGLIHTDNESLDTGEAKIRSPTARCGISRRPQGLYNRRHPVVALEIFGLH